MGIINEIPLYSDDENKFRCIMNAFVTAFEISFFPDTRLLFFYVFNFIASLSARLYTFLPYELSMCSNTVIM